MSHQTVEAWYQTVAGSDIFKDVTEDEVNKFVADIEYLGFDADAIRAQFFQLSKTKGRDVIRDLAFCIALCQERGANLEKMLGGRTSEQGKTRIKELQSAYGLKSKSSGAAPKVLTLPRICLAFPYQTCIYAHHWRRNKIIPNCPAVLTVQAFSNLLPINPTGVVDVEKLEILVKAHRKAMAMVAKKIGQNKDRRFEDLEAEAEQYIKMGMENTDLDDAACVVALTKLGIIDATGSLDKAISDFLAK